MGLQGERWIIFCNFKKIAHQLYKYLQYGRDLYEYNFNELKEFLTNEEKFDDMANEWYDNLEGPLDDKKVIAFIKSAYSKDQLIKIADIGAKKEEILKKYDRERDGKINL